ncbi:hypothetical protein M3N55_02715 [Roseibaca sp. V10]|uniref:Uncharacterized protein n=1 Tax=Roseinatronobacter domitianus TaxID=2940293 RepID=A0ABT0LYD8_9RHOB|nr:hypothetical protein [Roseibaca domitiana]MCL1627632.1 hypothetical protein [Roseibaca domitiana]
MDEREIGADEGVQSKRPRSPSFPYLDIDTAVDYAGKLYAAAKSAEVRLADVAAAWGMAPKSGSLARYVSALSQYGLIDTMGANDARRIKISAAGKRILDDQRPGVREQLRSEAALKPRIIRGLFFGEADMPHWGRDRPSDSIAESALKFDLDFGSDAAKRLLSVYDAAIDAILHDFDIVNEINEEEKEPVEAEVSESSIRVEVEKQPASPPSPEVKAEAAPVDTGLNKIHFRSEDGKTIYLSAKLDLEGLDLLAKKIEAFKLLVT